MGRGLGGGAHGLRVPAVIESLKLIVEVACVRGAVLAPERRGGERTAVPLSPH